MRNRLINEIHDLYRSIIEACLGVILTPSVYFVAFLHDLNLVASVVASVSGAIIGAHGVYNIFKRYRVRRPPRYDTR